ncbi:uncharacterized protein B0P05DRAFT_97633 [Gilbertella persicaria]|uniref:uncharacterized protein n=1 Tax=Gilbertella persicaria TaxID=101096 RepID=UPI002220C903|nr:uncharacterized protein B0P05DRAFT_97633 [Gilbertella persicaria]KAI8097952.1 hypothetical protein B0P05DRAFT_97633 [Gilbertella persicaria]
MAHPALAVCTTQNYICFCNSFSCPLFIQSEATLESQRFVRHSSPKNLSMVKFILNELSETERSYNQLLKLIQDVNKIMADKIVLSLTHILPT